MRKLKIAAMSLVASLAVTASGSMAQTVSPTSGGALPAAVSRIGGIVLDLIGANGTRVVTQLAASTLYEGFADNEPQVIGTQTGFTPAILSQLGGGLQELAVRITLYDGDTAAGDFDGNPDENTLRLNGTTIGSFDAVSTILTNNLGDPFGASTGFPDEELGTGFFFSDDATALAAIFASLESSGSLTFALSDVDPFDNFYDFKQGIDGSLINVGTGPVVTPPNPSPIPLPASVTLLGAAIGGLGLVRRTRR